MTDIIKFKRPNLRRTRAFSLAELMIATGILGIGMIIVAMAFPVALDQSRLAVEMTTSQSVFNEAVNTLKTQVKWTELERYINPYNGLGLGVLEEFNPNFSTDPFYRLGDDEVNPSDYRIYLLSFDPVPLDDPTRTVYAYRDFFTDTQMTNQNCVFSADGTYGWLAAVRKVSNQTYKFVIFVVREPTGILDGTNLKVRFRNPYRAFPASSKQLNCPTVDNKPFKGQILLDERGNLLKVTDDGGPSSLNVMLDQELPSAPHYFTWILGDNLTRKNPVVAVFETVISY